MVIKDRVSQAIQGDERFIEDVAFIVEKIYIEMLQKACRRVYEQEGDHAKEVMIKVHNEMIKEVKNG